MNAELAQAIEDLIDAKLAQLSPPPTSTITYDHERQERAGASVEKARAALTACLARLQK